MSMSERWLPRTLFGRLTIVLVGGMVAAQIAGSALLLGEFQKNHLNTALQQFAGLTSILVLACDQMPLQSCQTYLASVKGSSVNASLQLLDPSEFERLRSAQPPPEQSTAAPHVALRGFLEQLLPANTLVLIEQSPAAKLQHQPNASSITSRLVRPLPSRVVVVRNAYAMSVEMEADYAIPRADVPIQVMLELCLRMGALIVFSLIAARIATRPLANMAQQVSELDAEAPEGELPERGPKEVREVAMRINDMRQRILASGRQRSALLAGLSHDLRTPLTRLRLRLEIMETSEAQRKCVRDVEELQQMVQHTLEVSRSGKTHLQLEPLDVVAFLHEMLHDMSAHDRVALSGDGSPVLALAQPLALKRALGNIIENSLRYAESATLECSESAEGVLITLRDQGPGVPNDMLDDLMLPFVRVENSRSRDFGGAGLGLAIAKSLVEAQGGTLSLRNQFEPRGLAVTLKLQRVY